MISMSASTFVSQRFDFVIVGGGTAGLVVAARLAEHDPSIKVGVLEAGQWLPDEPKINIPGFAGKPLRDPRFDYSFQTVPQRWCNGRRIGYPRGKVLGGSSAINFLVFNRAAKPDYDNWEKLGNRRWNWTDLLKYFKKCESLHRPNLQTQRENHARCDVANHGTLGPVQIGFSTYYTGSQDHFYQTMMKLGFEENSDPQDGNNIGVWTGLSTIDPVSGSRSYAASAYFAPNADRSNLVVLTGAQATKIELRQNADNTHTATSVSFLFQNCKYSVQAEREVILCAGTFQSPQLLELSGIGSASFLSSLGLPTYINNPNVGENMQDHDKVMISYELGEEHANTTFAALSDPEFAAKEMENYLKKPNEELLSGTTSAFVYMWLSSFMSTEEISMIKSKLDQLDSSMSSDRNTGLSSQFAIQRQVFDDPVNAAVEILFSPLALAPGCKAGRDYVTIQTALQHPLSRGSVHLASTDPTVLPFIDSRTFENTVDLRILARALQFIVDKIVKTKPLKSTLAQPALPAPDGKEILEYEEFVKNNSATESHPIGTCAMLPAEMGGVVDANLKVYGTTNLRVVDASVIPLHISTHIQATVYAIAEKAVDIILGFD